MPCQRCPHGCEYLSAVGTKIPVPSIPIERYCSIERLTRYTFPPHDKSKSLMEVV